MPTVRTGTDLFVFNLHVFELQRRHEHRRVPTNETESTMVEQRRDRRSVFGG